MPAEEVSQSFKDLQIDKDEPFRDKIKVQEWVKRRIQSAVEKLQSFEAVKKVLAEGDDELRSLPGMEVGIELNSKTVEWVEKQYLQYCIQVVKTSTEDFLTTNVSDICKQLVLFNKALQKVHHANQIKRFFDEIDPFVDRNKYLEKFDPSSYQLQG